MGLKGRRRILSHREDIHCVVFHILVLTSYATAFWVYLHPDLSGVDTPGEVAAFVAASALMLGWISGVDVGVNYHNHVHREIFQIHWMNRWFARIWPMVGGWPALFWKHSHVTVHHKNILGPDDWTLPKRDGHGGIESILHYSLTFWPWRSTRCLWRDFRNGGGGEATGREAIKELLIFLSLCAVPFLVDPLMALWLWVLPQFVANVAVMGPGMYAQHFGCSEPGEEQCYTHSNTFLSRFFNSTMFNIGYHIEHHQWPTVHWSALPRVHARRKAEIVEGGGHVVPFGYYRGGQLLSSFFLPDRGRKIFLAQHPDYRPLAPKTGTEQIA